jgi:PHD/YefM family antitoxin component YafN of YafNO toxin-antitoxin module
VDSKNTIESALDWTYVKAYDPGMGIPKITKQSDLRDNLYKTLDEIATGGSPHLVPTKSGEVIIISRKDYDEILLEKELLQEFKEPIRFGELTEAETVFSRLDKKFGFKK